MNVPLDPDACYQAVRTRDRRFEGRFVVAVLTTGVYCRPGCPARTPRRENTRFFPAAAAAEAAGFRACRRCRPDRGPEFASVLGTAATVRRALRLLDDDAGATDLDAFAERLGLGARHLRRLFVKHLGASPAQIVRTRRLHLARQLVESSRLPLREVAFAAQFASVRRFNDAFRGAFGESPTKARRRVRPEPAPRAGIALRLAFQPPFDWESLTGFFAPRALATIESAEGGVYRRIIGTEVAPALLEVSLAQDGRSLDVRIGDASANGLLPIAQRVRRMFDLTADGLAIAEALGRDPVLRPLLARHPGPRIPGAWDPFEVGVRAILGQQVSVRGATTLTARLIERFGTVLPHPLAPGLNGFFPQPGALAEADVEAIGVPRQRASAVRAFAAAVASGAVTFDTGLPLEDLAQRLVELPGIGDWTAQYIALRAANEPDAFPSSDLGLCHATGLTPRALAARAEAWRPWRGYAAMLIWTDLVRRRRGTP